METVPKMISTKDLAYLSDMFQWNFTTYKQLKHFANEVENEEIQNLFLELSEMHYQHLEWILAILRNEDLSEEESDNDTECDDDEEESDNTECDDDEEESDNTECEDDEEESDDDDDENEEEEEDDESE